MDTGSAPVSYYVALYAIYNPSTGAKALLTKNSTLAMRTNVFSGANLAPISVWPTNSRSQFVIGTQMAMRISAPSKRTTPNGRRSMTQWAVLRLDYRRRLCDRLVVRPWLPSGCVAGNALQSHVSQ
ncbi:hypothetical protein [Burkholderia sp. SIMBA_048]|uniref:hypothetical protein n=1 Tax=unclassified Burkholderia TaxID=2613784 RepID=UPI00397DC9E3